MPVCASRPGTRTGAARPTSTATPLTCRSTAWIDAARRRVASPAELPGLIAGVRSGRFGRRHLGPGDLGGGIGIGAPVRGNVVDVVDERLELGRELVRGLVAHELEV